MGDVFLQTVLDVFYVAPKAGIDWGLRIYCSAIWGLPVGPVRGSRRFAALTLEGQH